MDKVKAHVPTGRSMNLIQAYKQQLDSRLLEQFKDDVAPIIEEVNADPERVSGDSHKLVALLKARDEEAGAKVHPAFKGLLVRARPLWRCADSPMTCTCCSVLSRRFSAPVFSVVTALPCCWSVAEAAAQCA